MAAIGMGLVIVGAIITLIGGIWFLVGIFQESVLLGVLTILFNPVGLICLFLYPGTLLKPFLVQLLGIGMIIGGAVIAATGSGELTAMLQPLLGLA